MANIGRVYMDSYIKDKKEVSFIQLDIRTITERKKFVISINKLKYLDGIRKQSNIIQGTEDHPDYHIWANFSNRGESVPSVIVGSIRDMVSSGGKEYKSAKMFDPFLSKHSIYFSLFSVNDEEKKKNPEMLYNVVASPYRASENSNNGGYNAQQAEADYTNTSNEPQQTYAKADGSKIPIDETHEIPF